ncbi:cupin domain-containing protein [Kitasatospora sp. NPDC096147]|uniref:cupin domain-containing protein n=1 Tax=Kitasatospora sp. NPDC096147 TaxID=3364093 RepID=UPI00382FB864
MRSAVIVADTRGPADVHGVHGTHGLTHWTCLARRAGLHGGWEAVEWARLPPGGVSGEHLHTRTEEVYVLLTGRGEITLDGHPHPVEAGDVVLTGLGTTHGLRNTGAEALDWLVIEMPARPHSHDHQDARPVGPPAPFPRPRVPIMRHAVVTNLRRVGPIDPGVVLTGPLIRLEAVRLAPGARVELAADGVEHTVFVTAGRGRAAAGEVRVPMEPGRSVTLPLGTSAAFTAGHDGLEYVHAVLAVAPPSGGGAAE